MSKAEDAKGVIDRCRRAEGFHASTDLYQELYLRDLVFSEHTLLKLGYEKTVKAHFEAFIKKQRKTGQLPNVVRTIHGVLQDFHSWTSDTEILFLYGTRMYADYTGDSQFLHDYQRQLESCKMFLKSRLDSSGFVKGADWRDAMITYKDKVLLSNQVLLVSLYDLLGQFRESDELRRSIGETFYSAERGFYADFVWWDGEKFRKEFHFDALGNALAIINDLRPRTSLEAVAGAFRDAKTQFGFRNISPPYQVNRLSAFSSIQSVNAFVRTGAVFRNRPNNYQNSSIWPFVESRIIQAFSKLGMDRESEQAFDNAANRRGFNEWYDPLTGEPKGSKGQLWTAASFLEGKESFS